MKYLFNRDNFLNESLFKKERNKNYNNMMTSFSKDVDNIDSIEQELIYKKVKVNDTEIETWEGIRKAGKFFAYGEPTVDIKLENNKIGSKNNRRGHMKGFFVTITTIDDSALYEDWNEPLNEEQMEKVLEYFNSTVIKGLKNSEETAKDLEEIIGVKAYGIEFS
jgi:uncharacterized protein with NRDE domain